MHVDARDASSPTRIDARFDVNDVAAARAARDRLHAAMQAAGATSTMRGLAELALSELLANVLRHAPGIADMRCEITADAVVINVLDDGPGFSFLPRLPHDHFSESGRGLYILAQLVETFSVDVRPGGGSHARAVIPLRGETVT
jgi:anti-sigma regulatory factor (Ser/Thr protein kinase)